MTTPQRGTDESLLLDGYLQDEFGVKNDPSNIDPRFKRRELLSKSRFTVVTTPPNGPVTEEPQTARVSVRNKANPRFNPTLRVQQTNIPATDTDDRPAWLYVSPSTFAVRDRLGKATWDPPIKVTVYHGVGLEMNRHGFRAAIERCTEPSALIMVPGIEPEQKGDPRWGIAIDDRDVRKLLEDALGRAVTYQVTGLAAFSTGINGLNQCLLNELIGLGSLRRIVIYDCLYTYSSGDTAAALRNARRLAGPGLPIVTYKCTTGGNSLEKDGQLSVMVKNPGLIKPDGLINLFYVPGYGPLVCFRSLQGGVADGIVQLAPGSKLEKAFTAMQGIVPARGTMVSSKAAFSYARGTAPPSGSVVFTDWANDPAHQPIIAAFAKRIGSVTRKDTVRRLIWRNYLPGWPGGDGEENHDLLLDDFGWEFLVP